MARRATGQVYERPTENGGVSYALRFSAYGKRRYVFLGHSADGWSTERAQAELDDVMALVRRGVWEPPEDVEARRARTAAVAAERDAAAVTFREYANRWWVDKQLEGLRPNTVVAYETLLRVHLLPQLGDARVRDLTIKRVDEYRKERLRESARLAEQIAARRAAIAAREQAASEGLPVDDLPEPGPRVFPLGGETINKALKLLGQILDTAMEEEVIAQNPLRVNPQKRRVRTSAPDRPYLDHPDMIRALLDAASELDASPDARTTGRRPMIATLVFAGLRITECCELTWADVDLAAGRLRVGRAKTQAGVRTVDMLPVLRDELLNHRAACGSPAPSVPVFVTAAGTARDKNNARQRVMQPVLARARELLAERDAAPLPERVTPHSLRRTFASLLFALGEPPTHVKHQLGHTEAEFTLKVYARVMDRDDGSTEALRDLIGATRAIATVAEAVAAR